MCGLAGEADSIGADHVRPVLARDSTAQDASEQGVCQTHAAPPTSAQWRAAHIGERRPVTEAGVIREQVASERATWRGYYSCCTVCSLQNLLCLDFLSAWVGRLSNRVGL